MSKFHYKYSPIASIEMTHSAGLLTEDHLRFSPDQATTTLINKSKLHINHSPTGLVVLYKSYEHFTPVTIDETVMIDDLAVINKKVVGYESIGVNGSFSNWLPSPADMTLTFYGFANTKFKTNTKWNELELNEFIKFTAGSLDGTKITDNTITYSTKPDAIFELVLTNANVTSQTETIFQFTTTII